MIVSSDAGTNPGLVKSQKDAAKKNVDSLDKQKKTAWNTYTTSFNNLKTSQANVRLWGTVSHVSQAGNNVTITITSAHYNSSSIISATSVSVWGISGGLDGTWAIATGPTAVTGGYKITFTVANSAYTSSSANGHAAIAVLADTCYKNYVAWQNAKAAWSTGENYYVKLYGPLTVGTGNGTKAKKQTKTQPKLVTPLDPVKYNLPGVKTGYFSNSNTLNSEVTFFTKNNQPMRVKDAALLWSSDSQGNKYNGKGMLQNYPYPTGGVNSQPNKQDSYVNVNKNQGRYGFQFMYNPGTVTMNYGGAAQVDMGQVMSDAWEVPAVGPGATTNVISFDLVINRMLDMAVLSQQVVSSLNTDISKQVNSKTDVSVNYARSKDLLKQAYGFDVIADKKSKHENGYDDVNQILTRGTMYDLEYLMRTLVGYSLNSPLRHFSTSDIGFFSPFPVELHLGKSLRYLVSVTGITVEHTIFTEDMIPVYTNINISASRMPDTAWHQKLDISQRNY